MIAGSYAVKVPSMESYRGKAAPWSVRMPAALSGALRLPLRRAGSRIALRTDHGCGRFVDQGYSAVLDGIAASFLSRIDAPPGSAAAIARQARCRDS